MIKGKTKSGFEYEIDEEVFNDWSYGDYVNATKNTEPVANHEAWVNLLTFMLGEEQYQKFIGFLRDKDGRLPNEKVFEGYGEILDSIADKTVKKS